MNFASDKTREFISLVASDLGTTQRCAIIKNTKR